jgi:hypothetical protein
MRINKYFLKDIKEIESDTKAASEWSGKVYDPEAVPEALKRGPQIFAVF